jgi:putative transcriptional regulator
MKQGKKRIGQQIVESLQKFVETLQSGADIETTFNCHRVEIPAGPPPCDAKTVKNTRKMLGASQAVFAAFLGVSVQTVRAWEQDENVPSDIAKRFMHEIRLNPDYWRTRLGEMSVPKKRAAPSK